MKLKKRILALTVAAAVPACACRGGCGMFKREADMGGAFPVNSDSVAAAG